MKHDSTTKAKLKVVAAGERRMTSLVEKQDDQPDSHGIKQISSLTLCE